MSESNNKEGANSNANSDIGQSSNNNGNTGDIKGDPKTTNVADTGIGRDNDGNNGSGADGASKSILGGAAAGEKSTPDKSNPDKSTSGTQNPDDKPASDPDSVIKPVTSDDITKPANLSWDDAAWKEFEPIAAEAKLSKEQVQKMIDLYAAKITSVSDAFVNAELKQWKEWGLAAENDKRFGGANFQANVVLAGKTINKFGSPELVEFLNNNPVGNHPELINFFVNVGKLLKEDQFIGGEKTNNVELKDIMYDNS